MEPHVFTLRDLEEARRRGRLVRRNRNAEELRDYLITFGLFAAVWLAREIFL
jgi:hypothetical protein